MEETQQDPQIPAAPAVIDPCLVFPLHGGLILSVPLANDPLPREPWPDPAAVVWMTVDQRSASPTCCAPPPRSST
jgi:hypothetical protein